MEGTASSTAHTSRLDAEACSSWSSRPPGWLPPRYYVPLSDIKMDLLRTSGTHTECPYKGTCSYWSVDTGQQLHRDLVWIYRTPLPESQKSRG
jgi:uncharacterized protein (DUF427 family)